MKTLLFKPWSNGIEPMDVSDYARKELIRNGVESVTAELVADVLYRDIKKDCIILLKGKSYLIGDYEKTMSLLKVRRIMLNTLDMCYYDYKWISKHSFERAMQFIDFIIDEQKKKFRFNDKAKLMSDSYR